MAVRPLLTFPDPRLKRRAPLTGAVDDVVREQVTDLLDTLAAHPGVGIAAPQIGLDRRIAIVDLTRATRSPEGTNHGRLALVDPVLLHLEGSRRGREGCLSLPEVVADVTRAKAVRLWFLDGVTGEERTLELEGFEATAAQHELDHLDGVLFVDRVTSLARGLLRRGAVGKNPLAAQDAIVELLAGHLAEGRGLVREALRIASRVHERQTRDEGTPYLEHPIRVARTIVRELGVRDPEVIAAALLHDTLEDAAEQGVDLTAEELARDVSPRVSTLVQALTKPKVPAAEKPARDERYWGALAAGPREAALVKLADRLDNLRGILASKEPEKRARYAHESFRYALPLARVSRALEPELAHAIAAVVLAERLSPQDFPGLPPLQ